MMMMLMAMMILFARIIMVIIRLAGADQNDPLSRNLVIMIIPNGLDGDQVWEEQQGTQEPFWRLESCS